MKRIPFDRFSDKRFYYANAPPCKQGFSLTTDFTWRILLCTKKFLIRFNLFANKRNLKDSTIHAYCTSVAHFLNHTAKDIDALTTDDVDIFLTEKKLSGISPETYNHYHSGIRFFYKKNIEEELG